MWVGLGWGVVGLSLKYEDFKVVYSDLVCVNSVYASTVCLSRHSIRNFACCCVPRLLLLITPNWDFLSLSAFACA